MKTTPLPIMRAEIAAAWLQAGNKAYRFSVTDMNLNSPERDHDGTGTRYLCRVVEYRDHRAAKTTWRRPAWFGGLVQALNWFNRTQERLVGRLTS